MAMQAFDVEDNDDLMNEINMTPFIDVILVLLIVFLVAIPAIHRAITMDLPQTGGGRPNQAPAQVSVTVRADGGLFWNNEPIAPDALLQQIRKTAQANPQTELHLEADRKVPYERVAEVMSTAQTGGLTRIGFVTAPKPNAPR